MADIPKLHPEEQQFRSCAFCTIQIPVDAVVCPHCEKTQPPSEKLLRTYAPRRSGLTGILERLFAGDRFSGINGLWTRYGKWIKVAGPVLAAILLLFLVFRLWVGHKVTILPNPELPIKVKQDKRNQAVLLTVMVTNLGEDVPDLSLKSIGVEVEVVYRDGRREKKTFFPKAEYHGEGSLLRGETGRFDFETPSKGLKEVVFRSEIVDLGMGRTLIPPGAGRRSVPGRR